MIRAVVLDDKEQMISIYMEYMEFMRNVHPELVYDISDKDMDEMLKLAVDSDKSESVRVYETDGVIVGIVASSLGGTPRNRYCIINMIYVKEEFRCRGIGTEMFNYVKENNINDANFIIVETLANNTFFDSVGMETISYNGYWIAKRLSINNEGVI